MQSSAAELSPTRPRERIETIDVLRGFALFGVLLVNIWDYGAELRPGELEFLERWPELANVAAVRAMEFCAEGKFFPAPATSSWVCRRTRSVRLK